MSAAGRDLRCEECRREPLDDERFRAYLTIDDEIAVYCPDCAEREFDLNLLDEGAQASQTRRPRRPALNPKQLLLGLSEGVAELQ